MHNGEREPRVTGSNPEARVTSGHRGSAGDVGAPTRRRSLLADAPPGGPEQSKPLKPKRKTLWKRFENWCGWIVDDKYFQGATMLITFYALFGDDAKLWGTREAADPAFDILN